MTFTANAGVIPAFADSPQPVIHLALVAGGTPGRPFLYMVPATGKAPLEFSAAKLPAGLTLDSKTGIIRGKVPSAGSYTVPITVSNAAGKVTQDLTLTSGPDAASPLPPMAWNSWSVYGDSVTDAKVRHAADMLISSGLAARGWQTVELGDGWQGKRGADGRIAPNAHFPDMPALVDYVHSKGLHFGIYLADGPLSYDGFTGSASHEDVDADTVAKWGVDEVTYQWCAQSGGGSLAADANIIVPFEAMRTALDNTDRDIVYSISTLGSGSLPKWAGSQAVRANIYDVQAHSVDTWPAMAKETFRAPNHEDWLGAVKPGLWPDVGYLWVGRVGYPATHRSVLSQSEQMTQVTFAAMIGAKLTLGCDLDYLDPSKYSHIGTNLLTNDEVIAIDQDPAGYPAQPTAFGDAFTTLSRKLADGSTAVCLCNLYGINMSMYLGWAQIGLKGPQQIHDVWEHKDLGVNESGLQGLVPAHSCRLFRLTPAPAPPTASDASAVAP